MLSAALRNERQLARGRPPCLEAREVTGCAGPEKDLLISVVVPSLDEQETIASTLRPLQPLRGQDIEIIVIDGGSTDGTIELAHPLADRIERAHRGRAAQMNAGARLARGDVLLFLHADTRLPSQFVELVHNALSGGNRVWGRFDVRIESHRPILSIVARMMNTRSRWSGVATGDQAIFVRRSDFEQLGGFPEIALMEDIALSKALKRISWPACLSAAVVTSSRRWERHGIMRTIFLMWRLRWAYLRGVSPAKLAVKYGYGSDE